MDLVPIANDTSILFTVHSIFDLRTIILKTLEKVLECLIENKLVLNVNKNRYVVLR